MVDIALDGAQSKLCVLMQPNLKLYIGNLRLDDKETQVCVIEYLFAILSTSVFNEMNMHLINVNTNFITLR